jgi:hypothetical protein
LKTFKIIRLASLINTYIHLYQYSGSTKIIKKQKFIDDIKKLNIIIKESMQSNKEKKLSYALTLERTIIENLRNNVPRNRKARMYKHCSVLFEAEFDYLIGKSGNLIK